MRKLFTALLLGAMLTAGYATTAAAQSPYPARPIRLVIPYPAGGSADEIARITALKVGAGLGQPVVVENRGGAATAIGAQLVATAPADGYTLLLAATPVSTNDILVKNLPYKASDFTPVAGIAKTVNVLSIHSSVPAKTFPEFLAYARANPGKLNYASSGVGGLLHLMTEKFISTTGVRMMHIPYQGAGPAWVDYVAGRIQVYFDSALATIPRAQNKDVLILAVGNDERLTALPDVPTLKELGFPINAYAWYGIYTPAGTPAPIVARLNAEVNKVAGSQEMRDLMKANGGAPLSGNPQEFAAFVAADHQYWADIVRPLNIQIK
jgi:tripartite-type tricarboxylate transporter receptor subunit TctC